MTLADAATPAIQLFKDSDAITMVAIAGAESNFSPAAKGDAVDSFPPSLGEVYREWSDEGYCSFGLWQIFLPAHHEKVAAMSQKTSPHDLATWLLDPLNNARIARAVLDSQGFRAWSTYTNGSYSSYLNDAGVGVAAAKQSLSDSVKRAIVAISLASPHVHIDLEDGSFLELMMQDVEIYGEWIRFNVEHQIVIDAFQNSR